MKTKEQQEKITEQQKMRDFLKVNTSRTQGTKVFHCSELGCGYSSPYISSIQRHQIKHSGEYFQCQQCPSKYVTRSQLKNHILISHQSNGLVCDQCSKTFQSRSGLHHHTQSEHTNMGFICVCGKEWKWRASYHRHRRTCKQALCLQNTQPPCDPIQTCWMHYTSDT